MRAEGHEDSKPKTTLDQVSINLHPETKVASHLRPFLQDQVGYDEAQA
jgi:hypothetical protein